MIDVILGAGWYNADSSLAHPEISKLKGTHDSSWAVFDRDGLSPMPVKYEGLTLPRTNVTTRFESCFFLGKKNNFQI